jgi:predicted DNA-binding transcriptional regulator YafY
VPRNAEVIRQWEILRAIDAARTGISIAKLAAEREVHQKTIRRDLEALCRAGFPLYDEKINGTAMWKVRARPFRALEETGMALTELAALYFSGSMLRTLAGPMLQDDLDRALMKMEKALPPECRVFLDKLPRVLTAKAAGRKNADPRRLRDTVARAFDAITRQRRITIRYASAASRRTKQYVVEPQRLSYADGGIYLIAWVPEYGALRTFAMERVETLGIEDDHFEPKPLPREPFDNSIGVHTGPPERIEIEFDASAAPHVRGRHWHKSQSIEELPDGSILLRLDVCNDLPLRSWILGFGPSARVVAPACLALAIADLHDLAVQQYYPRRAYRMAKMEDAHITERSA